MRCENLAMERPVEGSAGVTRRLRCAGSAPFFILCLAVAIAFSPPTGSETVLTARSFGQDGDVSIAGIFPIFNKDSTTAQCKNFRLLYTLGLVEPFLFLLQRRNFTLRASIKDKSLAYGDLNADDANTAASPCDNNRTRNGCDLLREIKIGFLIGDSCTGMQEPVRFSLKCGYYSPGRYSATNCEPGQGSSARGNADSRSRKIVALIGPTTSVQTVVSSPILSSYKIVQVSPAATSDAFACHLTSSRRCFPEYEYLFRTVPTDHAQAEAISDILQGLNWTHVGVVSSVDHLGMAASFQLKADKLGFCLAFDRHFSDEDGARAIISELNKANEVHVIVLFALDGTAAMFFNALVKFCANKNLAAKNACRPRVWVGSDGWGFLAKYHFVRERYRAAGVSTIISLAPEIPPQFDVPMTKLEQELVMHLRKVTAGKLRTNPGDPWLCQEMEQLNHCTNVCIPTMGNRSEPDVCPDTTKFPTVTSVGNIDHFHIFESMYKPHLLATEAVLTALSNLFQEFVDSNPYLSAGELSGEFAEYAHGERLLRATENVQIPCNDHLGKSTRCHVFPRQWHEVEPAFSVHATSEPSKMLLKVGKTYLGNSRINVNNISWPKHASTNTSSGVPKADCTPVCKLGEEKSASEPACCHVCIKCPYNHISSGNGPCQKCPLGQGAHEGRECILLPVKELSSKWAAALGMLIILSIGVILSTIVVYIIKRHTAIVRSDIILTWILLASLLVTLVASTLLLTSPTQVVCTTQKLLSVPAVLVSLAVLCVKTSRLARVGLRAGRLGKITNDWSMKTSAQLLFIVILTIVGTSIDFIHAIVSPYNTILVPSTSENFLMCSFPTAVSHAFDFYVIFIILMTTALAFITRKLPINFNEARFLFLCGFSLVTLWISFNVVYYLSRTEVRIVIDCLQLVTHTAIIWLWLFLPRLYIIVLRPKKNTVRLPALMTVVSEHANEFSMRSRMRSTSLLSHRPSNFTILGSETVSSLAKADRRGSVQSRPWFQPLPENVNMNYNYPA